MVVVVPLNSVVLGSALASESCLNGAYLLATPIFAWVCMWAFVEHASFLPSHKHTLFMVDCLP